MKKLTIAFISLLTLSLPSQASTRSDGAVSDSVLMAKEEIKTLKVKITGMSCAGCASHVHTALSKKAGIVNDEVKYPGDVAVIKYDAARISPDEIIKTIESMGYKAKLIAGEEKAQG